MRLWLFELLTRDEKCAYCRRTSRGKPNRAQVPQPAAGLASDPVENNEYLRSSLFSTILALHSMKEPHGEDGRGRRPSSKDGAVSGADAERDKASTSDQTKAARLIQRHYRGYRERRQMRGIGLSPGTRWSEAIKELQYRKLTAPQPRQDDMTEDEHARARRNWRRVAMVAHRAAADDSSDEEDMVPSQHMSREELEEYRRRKQISKEEREKSAKQMDLQYWLEMVDEKHRYGSNLRSYHAEWQKADTKENFFYWLDHGEGKRLDLPLVPRSRLDSEQVRYLSREERQNYLVTIDKEGRLCWAHNGLRITTSTAYKDSVDGIVPRDDIEHVPWAVPHESPGAFSSDDASSTMSTGHTDDEEAHHYVNHELKNARGLKKLKYVSAATILNQLLQKSVKPNSWIFVADTSFRLYVGIKQSGAFQHSSFLHGSRISAAGLIKIKDGQLRRLSPLSGHYRPPTKNFRLFVHSLKDNGVDMSRVSISRSYAVLVGLEAYVRTRKKIKHGVQHVKHEEEKILHPEQARQREEAQRDKSESAEKERRHLQRLQEEEREARKKSALPFRVMSKIRSRGYTSDASSKGSQSSTSSVASPRLGAAEAPRSPEGQGAEDGIPPEGTR